MNREVQKIIKRNQYRSKFYSYYKTPKEREKQREREKSRKIRESVQRPHLSFLHQSLLAILVLLMGMIIKKDPKLEFLQEVVYSPINLKKIEAHLTQTLGIIFPVINPYEDLEVNLPVITLETTKQYLNGVLVRTELFQPIESHVEGTVIKIYKNDELGEVIVIQDIEGREWEYGMLTDRRVKIYDRIYRGRVLGMAKTSESYEGGEFYLAIKYRKQYLDVVEVVKPYD